MMFGAAMPHQDRPDYERSIERGETAVSDSGQDADKVMAVLEECSPIGLDARGPEAESRGADKAPVAEERGRPGYATGGRTPGESRTPGEKSRTPGERGAGRAEHHRERGRDA